MYFSYHETDKQNFPHTAALLDQYLLMTHPPQPQPQQQQQQMHMQPQQRLLVTREVAPKTAAQQAVFDALAAWCVQNYNDNNNNNDDNDNDNNDNDAVVVEGGGADGVVEVHDATPVATSVSKEAVDMHHRDTSRLGVTLQEVLSPENYLTLLQAAAAASDVGRNDYYFTVSIRKALVWTLQTIGLDWTCTTNTNTTTTTTPTVSITAGILQSHLRIDRTAAAAIHLWPVTGSWGAAVYNAGSQQSQSHQNNTKPHGSSSLWGLLSQPVYTLAGKRLLEAWLRQPLVQLSHVQARQDAVALLVQRSVGRDAIRQEGLRLFQSSSSSSDLSALIVFLTNYSNDSSSSSQQQQQQQQQAQATLDDNNDSNAAKKKRTSAVSTRKALQSLYQLYVVSSQKLPLLLEQVEHALGQDLEQQQQQQPATTAATADVAADDATADAATTTTASTLLRDHVLLPIRQGHAELQRSVQLCEAVLDLDAAPREFLVQPVYDEHLQELQTELRQVEQELTSCHQDMNTQWEQVTGNSNAVRLERTTSTSATSSTALADHNINEEWQFRLPNTNDSKTLQQQFGRQVTIHRLLKNGVYFSTKQLRQLACKKQDLRTEYDRYQKQIAADALQVACSYIHCLEHIRDSIALLDVLTALAHVAAYSPAGTYCRPVLTDSDDDGAGIELKKARHPCVELQENLTEFIPNDVSLKFGESSFLLVTGPNSMYIVVL